MASPLDRQPRRHRFELDGDAACLDFVNTWGDRDRPQADRLHDYGDLLAFARQAGLLATETLAGLRERADAQPADARRAGERGRELRETLYRIFSARAAGRPVPESDLTVLNSVLESAMGGLHLEPADEGFLWGWSEQVDDLELPLWPVARSAAELLTGDDLDRLRECDGRSCSWLFLDRSRNRSRRWCSMATCGNRAKARRHYRRQRQR